MAHFRTLWLYCSWIESNKNFLIPKLKCEVSYLAKMDTIHQVFAEIIIFENYVKKLHNLRYIGSHV